MTSSTGAGERVGVEDAGSYLARPELGRGIVGREESPSMETYYTRTPRSDCGEPRWVVEAVGANAAGRGVCSCWSGTRQRDIVDDKAPTSGRYGRPGDVGVSPLGEV